MEEDRNNDYCPEAAEALDIEDVSSPEPQPTAPTHEPIPPSPKLYGSCAICLLPEMVEPTFIVPCYHYYCLSCISQWLRTSRTCPLCKATTQRLIYNVQGDRLIQTDPRDLGPPPRRPLPTARDVIYRRGLRGHYPPASRITPHLWMQPRRREAVDAFMRREVSVLLGDDADEIVLAGMSVAIATLGVDPVSTLQPAIEEWLGHLHAAIFLREITAFAGSGLTLAAWDSLVTYYPSSQSLSHSS